MRITAKWLYTRLERMNRNTVADAQIAELTPGAFVVNESAAGYSIALIVNTNGDQQTLVHDKLPRVLWQGLNGFEAGLSKAGRAR